MVGYLENPSGCMQIDIQGRHRVGDSLSHGREEFIFNAEQVAVRNGGRVLQMFDTFSFFVRERVTVKWDKKVLSTHLIAPKSKGTSLKAPQRSRIETWEVSMSTKKR